MKKKKNAFCVLLTSLQCCFGQTDPNVLAVGEWSAPVRDAIWPLRGRLIVYDAVTDKGHDVMWPAARVYLELQHVPDVPLANKLPIGVFTDRLTTLICEMRDGDDKPIAKEVTLHTGVMRKPFSATLPPDSTLRVRIDIGVRTETPDGLLISVPGGDWTIRSGATKECFLSATFSHPTNNPSVLDYHVWQGTLQLPKLKIPIEKIRKR
jgi:hypothetical protein